MRSQGARLLSKVLLCVGAVVLLVPSAASAAATVGLEIDGTLTINGTSGNDTITIGLNPTLDAYLISDPGGVTNSTPPPGGSCVTDSPTQVRCPVAGVGRIDIEVLGGDDVIVIVSSVATDVLSGDSGAGNDQFTGAGERDLFLGGIGNDTINGGEGNDFLEGAAGDDVLRGRGANDTLDGGVGNDTGTGGAGNDTLKPSFGNDRMFGGAGNDKLQGGGGNDRMFGNAGNDVLLGQAGNDVLVGGAGTDTLSGGAGNNVVRQ